MGIIEICGGYEQAKRAIENDVLKDYAPCTHETAQRELLEYRREHNIFEIGDDVVLVSFDCHASEIYKVLANKNFLSLSNGERYRFGMIRHATDEEIKFGCRVDQINAKILEKFGGRENVATILENAEGLCNVSTLGMTITVERLWVAYEQI